MQNRKLVIFSAPSGAGKTTIVRHLLKNNSCLEFSISATTRDRRGNEIDGKDYYFLSVEDFKNKIEKEAFAEYEEVYQDIFYGTLKSEIERIKSEGKHCVLDIDVQGGVNLKKQFGEDAFAIFVKPPDVTTLEQRLRDRNTDSEESILKRIGKAKEELAFEKHFDITLVNRDLNEAFENAQGIIDQFLS